MNKWIRTVDKLPTEKNSGPYNDYYITILTVGGPTVKHAHYNYTSKTWYNNETIFLNVIAYQKERKPKPYKEK